MNNLPRVLIVYICYGSIAYLSEVVSALEKLDYPKDRLSILFVPNGSPDGITDEIKANVLPRSGVDLPECILVDDGENRGFAGGNNHGMQYAIDHGFDYVFLENGDLKLHPSAISTLVTGLEKDARIGAAQSLVLYWRDHGKVNVSGGVFHVAGYGYARDNLESIENVRYESGADVAYCSGAAVMYRVSALKEVGLLEEGFFMYHEDLELGLRLRIAGYRNVIVPESLAYHDYQFSRNPKKFAWMELYRWVVVKSYYKIGTLLLLAPLLILIEIGTWAMALRGGWVKAKAWQYREAFRPATWKLMLAMRRRAQALRKISDAEFLQFVSGTIEAQEQSNAVVERIANPVVSAWLRLIKRVVRW